MSNQPKNNRSENFDVSATSSTASQLSTGEFPELPSYTSGLPSKPSTTPSTGVPRPDKCPVHNGAQRHVSISPGTKTPSPSAKHHSLSPPNMFGDQSLTSGRTTPGEDFDQKIPGAFPESKVKSPQPRPSAIKQNLPTTEKPTTSRGGVGSLPGDISEAGVARLPEEWAHSSGVDSPHSNNPYTHPHRTTSNVSTHNPFQYQSEAQSGNPPQFPPASPPLSSHSHHSSNDSPQPKKRGSSLPTTEKPSISSIGVGSLPGKITEAGVTTLPEEREGGRPYGSGRTGFEDYSHGAGSFAHHGQNAQTHGGVESAKNLGLGTGSGSTKGQQGYGHIEHDTHVALKVDLPSSENPSGSRGGVGSLPGPNTEAGVARLPDERRPRAYPRSKLSQELHGSSDPASASSELPSSEHPSGSRVGVGSLPGSNREAGVAVLPDERYETLREESAKRSHASEESHIPQLATHVPAATKDTTSPSTPPGLSEAQNNAQQPKAYHDHQRQVVGTEPCTAVKGEEEQNVNIAEEATTIFNADRKQQLAVANEDRAVRDNLQREADEYERNRIVRENTLLQDRRRRERALEEKEAVMKGKQRSKMMGEAVGKVEEKLKDSGEGVEAVMKDVEQTAARWLTEAEHALLNAGNTVGGYLHFGHGEHAGAGVSNTGLTKDRGETITSSDAQSTNPTVAQAKDRSSPSRGSSSNTDDVGQHPRSGLKNVQHRSGQETPEATTYIANDPPATDVSHTSVPSNLYEEYFKSSVYNDDQAATYRNPAERVIKDENGDNIFLDEYEIDKEEEGWGEGIPGADSTWKLGWSEGEEPSSGMREDYPSPATQRGQKEKEREVAMGYGGVEYLVHGKDGRLPGYPTEAGMNQLISERMLDDRLRVIGADDQIETTTNRNVGPQSGYYERPVAPSSVLVNTAGRARAASQTAPTQGNFNIGRANSNFSTGAVRGSSPDLVRSESATASVSTSFTRNRTPRELLSESKYESHADPTATPPSQSHSSGGGTGFSAGYLGKPVSRTEASASPLSPGDKQTHDAL